jgi:hypothetical protein
MGKALSPLFTKPARCFGLAWMTAFCFAISPQTTTAQATSTQPPRCTTHVSVPWALLPRTRSSNGIVKVEAFSDGPTCENAVIVYVMRGPNGNVLYQQAHQAQFVATTSTARTRAEMTMALLRWIAPTSTHAFYDNLPDWKEGASSPETKEFGFYPDTAITREDYLRIKSLRLSVRCYVQGMESMNCLIFEQGLFTHFGVQAFPG